MTLPHAPTSEATATAGSSTSPVSVRPRAKRAKYTREQKDFVREHYPRCDTLEEKEQLARLVGIDDIHKLYNLASRLGVTRSHEGELVEDTDDLVMPRRKHDSAYDTSRLWRRQRMAETTFTTENDRYLTRQFGKRPLEEIAAFCGHTETAILYRARHLDKRKPAQHWALDKVAAWMGMEIAAFRRLEAEGIDIFPVPNRRGDIRSELVSTTSLARWLHGEQGERWRRLIEEGSDEFFIHEILETVRSLQERTTEWESCKFLGAGHQCMNAYAGTSFGLFCTNNEKHRAGEDPQCDFRTLAIDDFRTIAPATMQRRDDC